MPDALQRAVDLLAPTPGIAIESLGMSGTGPFDYYFMADEGLESGGDRAGSARRHGRPPRGRGRRVHLLSVLVLPDPHDALAAFCETVAHVSRVDDGSRSRASEGLWLLDEAVTHQNPFPRSFSFCKSFHALDAPERAPAVVCERVRAWLDRDDEEYVLNVFGADPEALTRAYEATGHMLAWTFDLFARGIDAGAKPASAPAGHRIVPVDSTTLVDAINGHEPEYPSHTTALGDPERSEIAVLDPAGAPVAKGEIVCNVPGFVHVMGMWTLPARRREGLSRVVIGELHRIALERGARHAVLTASLQAARMGLYPKLGYAKVMGAARLVRAEASGR